MEPNGLMTIQNQSTVSMTKVVRVAEEFSQVLQPVMCMYNAAISVIVSRLEILQEEYKMQKLRNPIHHVDSRLKTSKSILGKLESKGNSLTLNEACGSIYDIAGVRAVCPYRKDVYLIRDRILSQEDITLVAIKDYVEHPKSNGYRSLHMIIQVPVYFMDRKQMIPLELQIRTLAMDLWASLEHDIKYKSLGQDTGLDYTNELLKCSRLIYQAEEKMEQINCTLEPSL